MYVIVKQIKMGVDTQGVDIIRPVIMIDDQSEILEFSTEDEAEKMRKIFEKNSTHGSIYEIKKI
jgi:hypothetical protein